MLILLPPSEGKTPPKRGRSVDLGRLSLPELTAARERLLDALANVCADEEKGQVALGLSPGQRDEVRRNTALRGAPTAAAGAIYTGVLYDALGLATLSPAAKRRAARSLVIFSGLWGVLRVGDRIPAYRCPIGARLPGIGPLGSYWRTHLADPMAELAGSGVVLDLRSSGYVPAWPQAAAKSGRGLAVPSGARRSVAGWSVAGRSVAVRVLSEQVTAGVTTRSVVSHFNKATKGRVVRDLLESGANPTSPKALVAALTELGYRVEGTPPALDLIVSEL